MECMAVVSDTESCKILSIFYTRHYCISIFLANSLAVFKDHVTCEAASTV